MYCVRAILNNLRHARKHYTLRINSSVATRHATVWAKSSLQDSPTACTVKCLWTWACTITLCTFIAAKVNVPCACFHILLHSPLSREKTESDKSKTKTEHCESWPTLKQALAARPFAGYKSLRKVRREFPTGLFLLMRMWVNGVQCACLLQGLYKCFYRAH